MADIFDQVGSDSAQTGDIFDQLPDPAPAPVQAQVAPVQAKAGPYDAYMPQGLTPQEERQGPTGDFYQDPGKYLWRQTPEAQQVADGVRSTLSGLVPHSPAQAAGFATPVVGGIEDIYRAGQAVNQAASGVPIDQVNRQQYPEAFRYENFQGQPLHQQVETIGTDLANALMGLEIGKGMIRHGPGGPVNAQEAPPARPEQVQATTTPGTTQGVDKASSSPENQPLVDVSRVSVPTVDDLKTAVSEGRLDDAKDIALQMERAAKQPAPVDAAQETPTFRPQDEPRPTDQAVGESAGQQQPAPERAAGVDTGQQGNLGESGQRTEGAPAGTSNRQNVETYGAGEVPSGTGVDTGELLDNARAALRNRSVDPNSILSRTRANGIANPQEYATLAAEHERLVNDAVAKEKAGDPTAPQAAQYAKDFANAIQPHKTAASDLFRLFQGDLNYDLGTQFGMDQYMQSELGHGMKPKDVPRFTRMSKDIRGAESEVPQAVTRSDTRVQGRYRNVADIPIQDAAARVRDMLKDCV